MKFKLILSLTLVYISTGCNGQSRGKADVLPINKTTFTKDLPQDSISLRWQLIVNRTCQKILSGWWVNNQTKDREGQYIDFGYLETNSKTGKFGKETKGGIRPAAQNAYTIAVALFTGAYDSELVSTSEDTALLRAVTIVKSLAKDHLANGGNIHAWGNQWQSAQWASKTAVAGWLLWDHLEDCDKEYVRKMIEYEANRFLTMTPPSANENYIINTHAEENGWMGQEYRLLVP